MGWRPDLIILDLGLPDVSGEDVAEALRAGGSTAYIVAYSGFHLRAPDALLAIVAAVSRTEKATA